MKLILVILFAFGLIWIGDKMIQNVEDDIVNNNNRTNNIIAMTDDNDDDTMIALNNEIQKQKKKRLLFIGFTEKMKGMPYQMGGVGNGNVDCSGLVYKASTLSGIPIPRINAHTMGTTWVKIDNYIDGDIPCFSHNGKRIAHVGVWSKASDKKMNHASSSKGVEVDRDIDDSQGGYWQKRYKWTVRHPLL